MASQIDTLSMADPGYSRGCANLLFGHFFTEKCMKMKEIGCANASVSLWIARSCLPSSRVCWSHPSRLRRPLYTYRSRCRRSRDLSDRRSRSYSTSSAPDKTQVVKDFRLVTQSPINVGKYHSPT